MSQHRLSKTVIEGGRDGYSKYHRRHSHRGHRAQQREAWARCASDDEPVFPRLTPAERSFRDKLGPAMRWLHSHVGQPWDRVRSKLVKSVDDRTMAGHHVLHGHMLGEVEDAYRPDLNRFRVAAGGLLRVNPLQAPTRGRRHREGLWEQALAFSAGRKVAQRGKVLLWVRPRRGRRFEVVGVLSAAEHQRWNELLPRLQRALRVHARWRGV